MKMRFRRAVGPPARSMNWTILDGKLFIDHLGAIKTADELPARW